MNGNVIRTITISGKSEGLDKLTADVNKLAAAQENVAVVSEQSAKRVLSLEDAWKRQTLKLDEAARAQANIARETKVADAALREGLATQAQHAQRLEQINQRYTKTADATKVVTQQTGLARHELVNLGRQAQDVGVSLMSGQSPFTVLVQQGTQIADVFATSGGSIRGFFSQAIGWAKGFLTSTFGIVTVIGAVGAAAVYAASQFFTSSKTIEQAIEEQNRLMKIGHSLRTTGILLLNNEIELQEKLATEMQKVAHIAASRAGTSTGVGGAGADLGPGLRDVVARAGPAYEQIIAAVQQLNAAVAQGQPGIQQFNTTIAAIGLNYPGVKATTDELLKVGEGAVKIEQAAAAAARLTDYTMQLATLYPTMSFEVAKQLQMQEAQLRVAQARTQEEKTIAQYAVDILQGKQQSLKLEEQIALAAGKQAIAEENIKKAIDAQIQSLEDNLKLIQARKDGTEATVAAEIALRQAREQGATEDQASRIVDLTRKTTDATQDTGEAIQNNTTYMQQFSGAIQQVNRDTYKTQVEWAALGVIMRGIPTQFGDEEFVSSYDPHMTTLQKQTYEQSGTAMKPVMFNDVVVGYQPDFDAVSDKLGALVTSNEDLTKSTDSLNATMQNALSPFYSQDPRTTRLGFRAGVTGNPDWMTGAGNANPLVAVLGAGATAPGMADGGSFTVGGGNSANDNRMAVFPVASGEQVVVNRNRQQGRGDQVVNIDNRIFITGSVDDDALSKMKVSRYQQAQRMRAGLARA